MDIDRAILMQKLDHIDRVVEVWASTGVSRQRAITRTVDEIRQLLAAPDQMAQWLNSTPLDPGLLDSVRAAVEMHITEPAQGEHQPVVVAMLECYAASYDTMGRIGSGSVDCASVAMDIRQNMIPVAKRAAMK